MASAADAKPPARIAIASDGACPSAEAVAHALAPMLPKAAIVVAADDADVHIHDDGSAFRVTDGALSLDKTIPDGARDCDERAETAAVVIGFAADPLAVPAMPERHAAVAAPAPAPAPVPAPVPVPPDNTSGARYALGAGGVFAIAGASSAHAIGATLRAYVGTDRIGAIAGVSGASAIDVASAGGASAQVTRWPFDAGARIRVRGDSLIWSVEAGATLAAISIRGESVAHPTSTTTSELGGRFAIRGELARATWTPFVAIEAEVVTSHSLVVEGATSGSTPSVWTAAVLGIEASL